MRGRREMHFDLHPASDMGNHHYIPLFETGDRS